MPTFASILTNSTIALLLISTSSSAYALGLGELELSSYLGEELKASIPVKDYQTVPEVGCFLVKDLTEDGMQRRVSTSLIDKNGQLSLKINTRAFVTDPIVTINVSYVCEPNMTREYVVLLDPAPLNNQALDIPLQTTAQLEPAQKTANIEAKASPAYRVTSPKPVTPKRNTNTPLKTKSTDDKLMDAYVGSTSGDVRPATNANANQNLTKQSTSKPYLVISGGQLNGGSPYETNQASLTLRLETEIDFARIEQDPLIMTNEEVMDEVTVMSNRLAYLEKQIVSLQTINTSLKTQLVAAENDGLSLTEAQQLYLRYILYAVVAIFLIYLVLLLRRELIKRQLVRREAMWFTGDNDIAMTDEASSALSKAPLIAARDLFADDDSLNSASSTQTHVDNGANKQSVMEQEAENVLDHAEVFIAHGRTSLAIQLLQNHLEEFPTESPNVWLRLLALLAGEESEKDYETAVSECNQFFNIKLPSYADALLDDDSSIEDYPHIVQRLEGVWGSQYAVSFLNDLIYNQQSQPREGFARNTFVELFFLRQVADILARDILPDETMSAYSANVTSISSQNVTANTAALTSVTPVTVSSITTDVIEDGFEISRIVSADASGLNPETDAKDAHNLNTITLNPAQNDAEGNAEERVLTSPPDVAFNTKDSSTEPIFDDDSTTLFLPDDADTEAIEFPAITELDSEHPTQTPIDTHTLEFDMSGLNEINFTDNTASDENESRLENSDNLIEFDWHLTDTLLDDNENADASSDENKPKSNKKAKPH